jgi:hypothetical protein
VPSFTHIACFKVAIHMGVPKICTVLFSS